MSEQKEIITGSVNASSYVDKCYLSYGIEVNTQRALPSVYDGLKPVQRRIVLALNRMAKNAYHNATSVVGNSINWYHPHGSSSLEGALVNLVCMHDPLVLGKGNFGKYRNLNGRMAPAAMRYVKVSASSLLTETYTKFVDYAPTFTNENDNTEQSYLPCLFPYALLVGSEGIGLGCITKIPCCNKNDLKKAGKAFLQNKPLPWVSPVASGEGFLDITKEELERFNTIGECKVTVRANITQTWDEEEQRMAFTIDQFPDNINPVRIKAILRHEIEEGLVYIRDESDKTVRIVVGREKRIKKITDEEILAKLRKATTVQVSYKNYVAVGKVAKVMTPTQMIETAGNKLIEAVSKYLEDHLRKLQLDYIFEKYKGQVAEQIIKTNGKELSNTQIIKALVIDKGDEITEDHIRYIVSKPISMLRKNPKDLDKLMKSIEQTKIDLTNPKLYYYNTYFKSLLN